MRTGFGSCAGDNSLYEADGMLVEAWNDTQESSRADRGRRRVVGVHSL